MQLSLMRKASFIDNVPQNVVYWQHDSNQISTIDDTRNFAFSKKQGYSLCCFLRFSKVGFCHKFRFFCYILLNPEKLIGSGKFHGKQTRTCRMNGL
ncbi:hypothetical protein T03_3748 [Trichinella britovi]|uniref:Uncharacterized protein n=1 Tax=Trichinella britovi TaxID=45882 RepID=A0A0V1CWJ4_TRIBR|nr:hypothetical protein T03_3748 [Trichinella britovi]